MAEHHEGADGGIAVAATLAQGLFHCLRIVHLAVADTGLHAAEALERTVGIVHELSGGDEFYAIVDHITSEHFVGVGMVAQQL